MDLGFSQRVVIVTGSSQGIGRAAALLFAKEGARVVVTYHSEGERAQRVVDEIAREGGEAIACALHLSDPESIHATAKAAVDRWGRIDALVNNAVEWGTRTPWNVPMFEQLPDEDWRPMLRANIEGAYDAIRAVLPAMRKNGWGRIVNVSSGIAVDGFVGAGPYAAAKGGLHGLTRTLAKELGPANILVNVVMPGFTLTERNAGRVPDEHRKKIEQSSPIRRILPPEEVVPTIVFLCSPMNTAVTGEILRASGGIT